MRIRSLSHLQTHPWLPYVLILTLPGILAAWFLFPSGWEFPMDDTYIHFTYAKNLAETGQLFFNQPGEVGVGSTSLTWVLLLAGAYQLGIQFQVAAKVLGLTALVVSGWGIYLLLKPILRPPTALFVALLVVASGHLLWFALSGMETTLFLMIGILALLFYRDRRWAALGVALGCLALTRPDGLALTAAIVLVEIWKHRTDLTRLPRGLLLAAALCLLICGPWFGYLFWRTGSILPTSAIGKQTSSLLGIRLVLSRSPGMAFLAQAPAIIYLGTWVVYLLEFVLGGISLPGPALQVGASVGASGYPIAITAIIGWVAVIAPLLAGFVAALLHIGRQKRYAQPLYHPLLVFAVWIILHNLAYALFLPIPGTASRYGTINHVALWLAIVIGLKYLLTQKQKTWPILLAGGLLAIACANTLYWNRVYDANLEHMHNVRIAAARFLTETMPKEKNCAAFDVGVMRFYTHRPIVDLGGLIDPRLGEVFRTDGRIDRYLEERGVRCVVLPGRTGTTEEGWFDFAKEMGLVDSPLFTMDQVRVFEIPRERWLLGYLPTNNYQATVTIYRMAPSDFQGGSR